MNKTLIYLSVVSSILVLFQWFTITSIRQYVFKRYNPITRKTAYLILAVLGVINFVGSRLAFDPEILGSGSWGYQISNVAFFSYLGIVLLLTLFFAILRLISGILSLPSFISHIGRHFKGDYKRLCSDERGCIQPPAESTDKGDLTAHNPIGTPTSIGASRRTFLQTAAITGIVFASATGGHGLGQAFSRPRIEEFDYFHHSLNDASQGFTVIQITDFHFGMFLGKKALTDLVEQVNSIDADAVVITGDLFHSQLTVVEDSIGPLQMLKPRRFGNFAIMGNHDFYSGEMRSVAAIRQSGLVLLRNEWRSFQITGADIHIGGIDDPMVNWVWGASFPNYDAFMQKQPTTSGFRLLLSHRPNVLPLAAQTDIDLVLAGHIHGGQVIVPTPGETKGWSIASIVSQYTNGWYKHGEARMYLNRGAGLTFVPWRINCPPEIAVIHVLPPGGREDYVKRSKSSEIISL